MRVHRLLMTCVAALALACGGGEAEPEPTGADEQSGGEEVATTEPAAGEETAETELPPPAEADEPEVPDDGLACLPVSRCHSFANQDCALVDEGGAIQDESVSGRVQQACPGERGVADSVQQCFDYIEAGESCGRNMPALRAPEWPCGRTPEGGCEVQML
ncbi:MAG TPA: hypothetical protein RMH99_18365 [Sandaracinaceae bacterium LLY-WYZ-13_1]|nr:hypothetical protein [Sandaracinaceae bacterium LLY-WYZ-13_1]